MWDPAYISLLVRLKISSLIFSFKLDLGQGRQPLLETLKRSAYIPDCLINIALCRRYILQRRPKDCSLIFGRNRSGMQVGFHLILQKKSIIEVSYGNRSRDFSRIVQLIRHVIFTENYNATFLRNNYMHRFFIFIKKLINTIPSKFQKKKNRIQPYPEECLSTNKV